MYRKCHGARSSFAGCEVRVGVLSHVLGMPHFEEKHFQVFFKEVVITLARITECNVFGRYHRVPLLVLFLGG